MTGAGTVPKRSQAAEQALSGTTPDAEAINNASLQVSAGIEFMGDMHASEEYRAHLTRVFTARALTKTAERSHG